MELAKQKCIPCEGGIPPLQAKALEEFQAQLDKEAPGWELKNNKRLEKTFKFPDFRSALNFTNSVGALAEQVGHHPNIELGWGFVRILLWTHAIGGLSQADFALAAKISELKQA